MTRFLFRVQYSYDDQVTYEPVCIRTETETEARAELVDATARYAAVMRATRSYTLLSTTVEA